MGGTVRPIKYTIYAVYAALGYGFILVLFGARLSIIYILVALGALLGLVVDIFRLLLGILRWLYIVCVKSNSNEVTEGDACSPDQLEV
jgi:hypothetical protein